MEYFYDDFIAWMKTQPQRNNPNKTYKEVTIKAAAYKLKFGMKSLGINEYADTDCFSIKDVHEFQRLHDKCYKAAEKSDNNNGHSDF